MNDDDAMNVITSAVNIAGGRPQSVYLASCEACGTVVDSTDLHLLWHEALAQLFTQPEPEPEIA